MSRAITAVVLILMTLAAGAGAASSPTPPASQAALAGMEKLADLEGTWRVIRKVTGDGGASWRDAASYTVRVRSHKKGLMLEEKTAGQDENLFHMTVFTTFDQYQSVYRQAAIEDHWGLMDVSEGRFQGGLLVLDNLESKTHYPMDDGRLRALRVRIEVARPQRITHIDESYDGGRHWTPAFQLHYRLQETPVADRVLTGGRIYTVNDSAPWAEAVAIRGGRFVYVGDNSGAEAFIGDHTVHTDLGGRFVMPGIIDSHTHPGMMGIEQFGPPLPGGGREAVLEAVKAHADSEPGDGWIKLCCWSNLDLLVGEGKPPGKELLDAAVADRPVWLTSLFWHSYWLNSKALEVLGVDAATPDPAPGVAYYVRDENGEPTGWVKEGAGWQHMARQFPVDRASVREGIDRSLETLASHGVTTVYDGGNLDFEDAVYGYLSELDAAGKLPLRYEGTYMVYLPGRRHKAVSEMKRLRFAYGGERLKFRTVKLFLDGITPALSSAVSTPYTGYPGQAGDTLLSVRELRDWLLELHRAELDLHIHTVGDVAVRRALDAVEAARAVAGDGFYPRVTLAHLQVIAPGDRRRFAELGVSAVFTPWWHGYSARDPSVPLLGETWSSHFYPANEVIESGGNVAFSSDDWGEEVMNPFLGIEVGHTRRFPEAWLEAHGASAGDFRPPASERIPLAQMIRGYTLRGAFPLRLEGELGSIEVGKRADMLVLERNLFEIDPHDIHGIRPSAVIMDGEVVRGDMGKRASARR